MKVENLKSEEIAEQEAVQKPSKVAVWKSLPLSQKATLFLFFFFLLIFPVMTIASLSKVNLLQKAAENPVTLPSMPTSAPTPVLGSGAYLITLTKNPSATLTCTVNDPNCLFSDVFRGVNRTNQNLYNTTIKVTYSSTSPYPDKQPKFEYQNFDGVWTSAQSKTTRIIAPGEGAITSQLRLVPPPGLVGEFTGTLYMDGQTCNLKVSPPDCYYYGAGQIKITLKVVKSIPNVTPTTPPTPIPAKVCNGCWNNLTLCSKACGQSCIRINNVNEIQSLCGKPAKNVKYAVYSCCSGDPRRTLIPTSIPTPSNYY